MPNRTEMDEVRIVLTLTGLALALAILVVVGLAATVTYTVDLSAVYSQSEGQWRLDGPQNQTTTFDETNDPHVIELEHELALMSGSQGRLEIIADSGAWAYLSGETRWTLIQAQRRGTAIQHIRGESSDYVVVIQQTQGNIIYDFSAAHPALNDLNLTIRFPDGQYTPDIPCFQANAPTEGVESSIIPLACGQSDRTIQPQDLPTLE